MKELIPIGTIVRIKPDTRYYGQNYSGNPSNINGIVTEHRPLGNSHIVTWDNGKTNVYDFDDLEIIDSVITNTYPVW